MNVSNLYWSARAEDNVMTRRLLISQNHFTDDLIFLPFFFMCHGTEMGFFFWKPVQM